MADFLVLLVLLLLFEFTAKRYPWSRSMRITKNRCELPRSIWVGGSGAVVLKIDTMRLFMSISSKRTSFSRFP